MTVHKFRIGQVVMMRKTAVAGSTPGAFKVTRLLPPTGMTNQYRLKAVKGDQERVAREDELQAQ